MLIITVNLNKTTEKQVEVCIHKICINTGGETVKHASATENIT